MALSIDKYPSKKAKKGYLWRVRFKYTDAYGKKHPYQKAGFETKKAAEMHGLEKLKELEGTTLTETKEITLGEIWKEFESLRQTKINPTTLNEYKTVYWKYIDPAFGQTPVKQIGFIGLQKFFDSLDYLSHSTQTKIKSALSHCFKTALKMGVIVSNPLHDVELGGKRTEKKDDYISPEAFRDLEDRVKCSKRISEFQIENRLMVLRIGYHLGLRFGEILGLKFDDIDWQERTITIQRQIVVRKGGAVLTDQLKTKASYATLPLSDALYDYLVAWKKKNPFDFIITSNDGTIVARRTLENYFHKLKSGFHVHQLRHSFATNLYLAGVDQVTAASLTRHSSVEILNNIYTHPQDDKKREAILKTFPLVS